MNRLRICLLFLLAIHAQGLYACSAWATFWASFNASTPECQAFNAVYDDCAIDCGEETFLAWVISDWGPGAVMACMNACLIKHGYGWSEAGKCADSVECPSHTVVAGLPTCGSAANGGCNMQGCISCCSTMCNSGTGSNLCYRQCYQQCADATYLSLCPSQIVQVNITPDNTPDPPGIKHTWPWHD